MKEDGNKEYFNPEATDPVFLMWNRSKMKDLLIVIPGLNKLNQEVTFKQMLGRKFFSFFNIRLITKHIEFFAALSRTATSLVLVVDYMNDDYISHLNAMQAVDKVVEICHKAFTKLFEPLIQERRIALSFLTHGVGAVIATNLGMAINTTYNNVIVKYIFGELGLGQLFALGKQYYSIDI